MMLWVGHPGEEQMHAGNRLHGAVNKGLERGPSPLVFLPLGPTLLKSVLSPSSKGPGLTHLGLLKAIKYLPANLPTPVALLARLPQLSLDFCLWFEA